MLSQSNISQADVEIDIELDLGQEWSRPCVVLVAIKSLESG